ncbi:polyprenol monophosphomannose synthase [Antrihabitans cavernicola]|uniref:dolichyl-phosphate beta-D-mannosyltransferase n=1 Tax=Antrihabitans cavernicola TaxID=2495913 RepID=A0A5A7SFP6_9NOCA|nr:polyprenol monophosphomannose synthase [Spelaeibacter cavernicola]KAA0024636.1 polyprenol monophosphomannose synthase [Spelaeibacter cavernicola]
MTDQPAAIPAPWSDSDVVVVIPTFNEADNVPLVVGELLALPLPNLRILIADDNSPDGTGEVADNLALANPGRLIVLHRTGKQGLGRAYVDGMNAALDAGADFVVQMDADLSHPTEYVPQLLGTMLSTGAGLVIGSRYVSGGALAEDWPLHRKMLSGFANFYVERLLSLRVKDMTAGFKMWRADALREIDLDRIRSNGYSFQVEMHFLAQKQAVKTLEIPIHFNERQHGESKMSFKVKMESAIVPFRLRWHHRKA